MLGWGAVLGPAGASAGGACGVLGWGAVLGPAGVSVAGGSGAARADLCRLACCTKAFILLW